jgi:hypothetical protein
MALYREPFSSVIEKFFRIQRRHATEASAGYGLTINLIGNVAGSKYTGYAGFCGVAT